MIVKTFLHLDVKILSRSERRWKRFHVDVVFLKRKGRSWKLFRSNVIFLNRNEPLGKNFNLEVHFLVHKNWLWETIPCWSDLSKPQWMIAKGFKAKHLHLDVNILNHSEWRGKSFHVYVVFLNQKGRSWNLSALTWFFWIAMNDCEKTSILMCNSLFTMIDREKQLHADVIYEPQWMIAKGFPICRGTS